MKFGGSISSVFFLPPPKESLRDKSPRHYKITKCLTSVTWFFQQQNRLNHLKLIYILSSRILIGFVLLFLSILLLLYRHTQFRHFSLQTRLPD
ncbi:MAG: DUF3153 domain-containing protein [Stygiobacter sp.]|nr:MAG: DUF3153 domain-containing protein [Stygiobacter sp.]